MNEEIQGKTMEQENMKTIFDCWTDAIKHFFDIRGRTTRYEFWAFQTVSLFIFISASLIGFCFDLYKIVFEIYAVYFLAPATAISIRRLHDMGLSGKWAVPAFILAVIMLISWELGTDFVFLPLFLLLCYISYLYWLLSDDSDNNNIYGNKIDEPEIYNQDSKVFIIFMALFLSALWIIFLINTLF
ncbi:MAG: DUF805 domain-containing protein [Alphaproteobacteria bacterium]|nr:DUF805 domain-containing protein [Alphaproteobacteria bacterium]